MHLHTVLYVLGIFAVILVISVIAHTLHWLLALIRIARVGALDLLKSVGPADKGVIRRFFHLIEDRLYDQAALLCHRGEQVVRQIIDEPDTDEEDLPEARLTMKKLAFMKGRPDLLRKYGRLPYICYEWMPSDDSWRKRARDFRKEWKEMGWALDLLKRRMDRLG